MARIGVVFSSGFFGFFAHAGFLASIRELGISPVGYGGASSGAIIAAMAASGIGDQDIQTILFGIKKDDFWDPDPWYKVFLKGLRFFRGYKGYLKGYRFAELLNVIPINRIEDCKNPLIISATNLTLRKETIFTQGDLKKAVWASGAVPMLFKPVKIDGSMYVDGGLVRKAPVKAVADLIKPDKIIIHFIDSYNMGKDETRSFWRQMKPWHIYQLGVNIARRDAYAAQCELIRQQGIKIIEVNSNAPSVSPNRIKHGPIAYQKAKEATKEILSRYSL